jgi:hypothetical protein
MALANTHICPRYPPCLKKQTTKDKTRGQHGNKTSNAVSGVVGDEDWDYNDVFPFEPTDQNSDFPQSAMESLLKARSPRIRSLLTQFLQRLRVLVAREHAHGNKSPVVLFGGVVANCARKWLLEDSLLEIVPGSNRTQFDDYSTAKYRFCDDHSLEFFCMEDAVHPSHHLMAARSPTAVVMFRATYFAFAEFSKCQTHNPASLRELLGSEFEERHKSRLAAYDQLGIPHNDGWLRDEHRHLRLCLWDDKDTLAAFQHIKSSVDDKVWSHLLKYVKKSYPYISRGGGGGGGGGW